jgi:hypothetical protein
MPDAGAIKTGQIFPRRAEKTVIYLMQIIFERKAVRASGTTAARAGKEHCCF